MKPFATAAIILAIQSGLALSPASAAPSFAHAAETRTRVGAFAGARLRIPFGGEARARARIGLTLAPTRQDQWSDGRRKVGFGEGLELGFAGGEPLAAWAGGQRLTPGKAVDDRGRRLGISTIGTAGIVAVTIVAGLAVYALAVRGDED